MYFLFLIPYILQLILVIHIFKTRQDFTWLWLLVFLPYVGGIAYIILVFIPSIRSSRGLHKAGNAVIDIIRPKRHIAELEKLVHRQNTISNRVLLADSYAGDHRYEDALALYDSCLSEKLYKDDIELLFKRAKVLYEAGRKDEAKAVVKKISKKKTFSDPCEKLFVAKVNDDIDSIKEMFFSQSDFEAGYEAASYYAQNGNSEEVRAIADEMKDILQTYKYLRKTDNSRFYRNTKKLLK